MYIHMYLHNMYNIYYLCMKHPFFILIDALCIHHKVSIKFKGMIANRFRVCEITEILSYGNWHGNLCHKKYAYALLGSSLGNNLNVLVMLRFSDAIYCYFLYINEKKPFQVHCQFSGMGIL